MSYLKALHRKVRTGCKQCKKRRIKCDESKPVCANCVRYSSTCSYARDDLHDSLPWKSGLDKPGSLQSSFSFADLELLHHWTVVTAKSLAPNEALQQAMRVEVPRLANKYRYLMHAILALSALHIAYLRPDQSDPYLLLAASHESMALPLIRSALTRLDEDNCHAVYACGHMVVKYAFASPQSPGSLVFSCGAGTVSEFVPLLRGAFSIHDYALGWLMAGPLGPSIERPFDQDPSLSHNPDDKLLASLLPLFIKGGKDGSVCCEALNALRRLFAMIFTPNQTLSTKTIVYSWPVQVPQRYIILMSERNQAAIVVLAHYCIMLNMIDSFWFMEGCAARLLDQCRKELDKEWLPHIQWPLSVVGL